MRTIRGILLALVATFVVTQAHAMRWYSPNTGRWFSRDPIEEEAGPSLTCFLHNAAVNTVDPLGQVIWIDKGRAIRVEPCEIVILFGHGYRTTAPGFKWSFMKIPGNEHACNGATAVTCWPIHNAKNIPPDLDVWPDGLPKDYPYAENDMDGVIAWGSDPKEGDPWLSKYNKLRGEAVVDAAFEKAKKKAKEEYCKSSRCFCCDAISIRFLWSPVKGNLILDPKKRQTDYRLGNLKSFEERIIPCN